jgi:hypothetical protein
MKEIQKLQHKKKGNNVEMKIFRKHRTLSKKITKTQLMPIILIWKHRPLERMNMLRNQMVRTLKRRAFHNFQNLMLRNI